MYSIKAKYKDKDKLIPGKLEITDKFVIFTSGDNSFEKKIPIYRIVQTGFRRKFFFFEKKFYFKTSDGLPHVFYVSKPKKCMKILDKFVY